MHLAALRPQALCVSTYFAGGLGVVGGGPPKIKTALTARSKNVRLPPSSNVSIFSRWMTIGYDSHSADE